MGDFSVFVQLENWISVFASYPSFLYLFLCLFLLTVSSTNLALWPYPIINRIITLFSKNKRKFPFYKRRFIN